MNESVHACWYGNKHVYRRLHCPYVLARTRFLVQLQHGCMFLLYHTPLRWSDHVLFEKTWGVWRGKRLPISAYVRSTVAPHPLAWYHVASYLVEPSWTICYAAQRASSALRIRSSIRVGRGRPCGGPRHPCIVACAGMISGPARHTVSEERGVDLDEHPTNFTRVTRVEWGHMAGIWSLSEGDCTVTSTYVPKMESPVTHVCTGRLLYEYSAPSDDLGLVDEPVTTS